MRLHRALLVGLLVATATVARGDDTLWESCRLESTLNPIEHRIAACTAMIASPDWLPEARANAFNSRGRAYLRNLRDPDKAIHDFDQAIKIKPDFAAAYRNRGNAWINKGDYTRAIADFDRAVAMQRRMPLLLGDRAFARMSNGDYTGALKDWDEVAPGSEDATPYAYRCWARLRAGRPAVEAVSDCTQSLNYGGRQGDAYVVRGIVEWRQGQFKAAVGDFNSALRRDPELAVALYARSLARAAIGDAGAVSDKAAAKALVPSIERIADLCGDTLLCPAAAGLGERRLIWCNGGPSSRVDQQITGCTEIINSGEAKGETLARAHIKRSRALLSMGAKEEALSDAIRAIAIAPNNPLAFMARAQISFWRGRYAAAIPDFDEAIRLAPNHAPAYFFRGLAKRDDKQYDGAIADFDRAIALDQAYVDAFAHRAGTYARTGDHRRAIMDYDKAILLDADDAYAHYGRSESYRALGDRVRALRNREQAIRLNPVYGEDRD